MLPDLSPAHILIVVVAALVFIGPKDLPLFLRKVGQFMGKMRGMANEFRASFDEMARQSELDELRKEVEAMRAAAHVQVPDLGLESHLNLSPHLGLGNAMQADAEGAYINQWQTAQAAEELAVPAAEPPVAISAEPEAAEPPKAKPAPKPRAKKPKPAAEAES